MDNLTKAAEYIAGPMTYTVEFLGKDAGYNLGGKTCKARRLECLQKVRALAGKLTPGSQNNYRLYESSFDSVGMAAHGNDWPEMFLREMKTVLHDMKTTDHAFEKFVFAKLSEMPDTKALTVPGK